MNSVGNSIKTKEKTSPSRKVIFNHLVIIKFLFLSYLLLIHVLLGFLLLVSEDDTGYGFLMTSPVLFILAVIDFILVFSYISKQQPREKNKVISYVALIVIGFVVILAGVIIFVNFGPTLMFKFKGIE